MPSITMPGLASGLDVNALITTLVAVERQPLDAVNSKQAAVQSASQTITSFSSRLSALQTAARALGTSDGFASNAASSSDTAVAASAAGAAAPGTYDITVSALAREQRTYSNTFASSTTALGMSGTLRLTVGAGAPTDVTVTASDTLTTLASRLSSSGARVSAAVLYDGTNYRLQVRGLDTGAANSIAFDESGGTTLGLATPANTFQTAQNASLQIDGIAVSRPTNQVTGVIPGVTLALARTTSSPATVRVAADPASLRTKISAFVTAYNDVVSAGHNATGYGSQKPANAVLAGDRAIRGSLDRLAAATTTVVPGATGAYTTLASVGVSSNRDGTLKLDAAKFDAAIAADPTGVAKLFVTDPAIGATGAMDRVAREVTSLTSAGNGLVNGRLTALQSQSRRLSDQAIAMQDRLARYRQQLTAQFTAMDQAVARYRNYPIPDSGSSNR